MDIMAEKIVFQFDDKLDYQQEAVRSVVELFRGMEKNAEGLYGNGQNHAWIDDGKNRELCCETMLLDNLRHIQKKNRLFPDQTLGNDFNFTIEMETGTGKTYVYLRTLLELYREYGFTKFIVAVPSIAIRKGVEKSVEQLREHFRALYGLDLKKHSFVYDSTNPKRIQTELVDSNEFCICIMNIQAFNKDTNKIRSEDESGTILWNEIQSIRPIVIMDEPQKMEGEKGKKSKSLQALEELNPLFTLRYSATHRQLHHVVYKLDSYAAYQKHLVKEIQVKTVRAVIPKDYPYIYYRSFTPDLKAEIELFHRNKDGQTALFTTSVRGNTSLFELSGEMDIYRNMRISQDPHKLKPLTIETSSGNYNLMEGSSNYEVSQDTAVQIQIQLAIKNHFEKQLSILKSGKKIKVLTLFFVDSVEKVRDSHRQDKRGVYLRIFDEEYQKALIKYAPAFQKYHELFPGLWDTFSVREGYFAVDKKNRAVEIEMTEKIKAKSQEDIDRGISLILEKKDELISFESPLAFIFSHSALREGWDNPNVFTLCTLKSGGSEIAKKQEIGRGLRLAVDINGNQCRDTSVNELTVIANDYYDHFARTLQADFNSSINYNPKEVTMEMLYRTLHAAGIQDEWITDDVLLKWKQDMIQYGILSEENCLISAESSYETVMGQLLSKYPVFAPYAQAIADAWEEQVKERFTRTITIKNGDQIVFENEIQSYMEEKIFQKRYHFLCNILSRRMLYKVQINKEDFIQICRTYLVSYLENRNLDGKYQVQTGIGKYDETGNFQIKKQDELIEEGSYRTKECDASEGNNREGCEKNEIDLINAMMYHTLLPRQIIAEILAGLRGKEWLYTQEYLEGAIQLIQTAYQKEKASHISGYEIVDGVWQKTENMFSTNPIWQEEFTKPNRIFSSHGAKAMHKYYRTESREEYDFARRLEEDRDICFFVKLNPGSFIIDTPYGNFTPSWIVVQREECSDQERYIIVDWISKYKKTEENEKQKFFCAQMYLEELKKNGLENPVYLIQVDTYQSFEKEKKLWGKKGKE